MFTFILTCSFSLYEWSQDASSYSVCWPFSDNVIPNIRIIFFVHANPCAYIALLIPKKCGSHGNYVFEIIYICILYFLFYFQCIYYGLKIAFPVQYVLWQLSTFMSYEQKTNKQIYKLNLEQFSTFNWVYFFFWGGGGCSYISVYC